jgi:hypothetical protein
MATSRADGYVLVVKPPNPHAPCCHPYRYRTGDLVRWVDSDLAQAAAVGGHVAKPTGGLARLRFVGRAAGVHVKVSAAASSTCFISSSLINSTP